MRDGGRHLRLRGQSLLIVLLLGALLVESAAAADICGYAAKGTLMIARDVQTVSTFRVGLAETHDQQRRGLMGCRDLAPGTGLLFIYPDARQRIFWMKDTPLALAILFISSSGRIAAIEEGRPFSTHHIRSPDSIQYVLEIHLDEGDALQVGDRITLQLTPE